MTAGAFVAANNMHVALILHVTSILCIVSFIPQNAIKIADIQHFIV